MKKLLIVFTLTILTICMAWAQSQIIGSYPSMDGGFENESGTLATASSISSAQSYWTTQVANKGVIQNTGGRSGPKYVQYSQSGTTHKRLQSPTANVTAASHVVQFYYQGDMDGTIGGDIRGAVSAVGTSSPQYGAYITSANTGTVWTKYTAVVTTTGTPANGVGIVSTINTCTFYIDDFVVYPGSSVDVTAPNSPGTASVSEATTNSLKISWVAASGGVDGGGYLLIRYSSQPGSGNDPNVNGIYAIGNSIGSGIVTYIGTDTYFTDNNLSPNTTYWYRIYTVDKAFNYSSAQSVSGSTTGEQVSAPTTQASNITFSSIESTQMTVSWTNGNGTKRIAKMNTSSSFTNPSDGSDPTADDSWNNSGEQVIYNGSGNSVTVTNLSASTTYWVRVYEYNGSGTGTKYLTATATNNPNSQTTSTPPPSAPTATAATNVSYNKFTANWNSVSGATKYYLDVYTKSGGATDLIISEYVEGSSNNKAIELYNGTGSSIDLSNYSLKKQTNGAGDFGNELTLSGTLANNDTYVIVSNLGTPNLVGQDYVDLDTNSQALNFNGNDAVALYKNGVQLDVVGVVNQTSDWGKDVTLVRKSSVTSPTTSYSTDQWDSFAIDTFTYLGSHTMDSSTSYVSGYQNKDVGNVTSYEVSGLNSNTTYYYVVRAYNDNGSSANSNEISVTTLTQPTPTITVNPESLTGFSYVFGSGPSSEQSFTISGYDLTADISIDAPENFEISKTSGESFSAEDPIVLTQSGGTVSETTIYVRLKAGLSVGDYNNETITVSSTGATSKTVTCSGTVCKPEPSNHCTNFTAANGTDPKTQITLSWTDATGSIIPDGYLIKAATGDYSNIVNPVDGTAETDGTYVKNIAAGVQTATFSNLNSSTTYYFKIFPYTNSGTNINYKTDGTVPQVSWTTASGPTIVEIILPQFIQGKDVTNNQRLPWACRLRLENLTANATYRYFGQFVLSSDGASTNGAGNCWFVNSDNTITRNTTLGMSTAGTYSEFTTNANGSYTGWFIGEPTANDRFAPGNKLYYRIMLNDGAGGTSVAMRLTTANFIKVINFGTEDNVDQGTFLYGVSRSPAKNFVFVYDNVEGTGRPIAGSIIEDDGLNLSSVSQILASYRTNVDNVAGAWGVIIPNSVGTKGFSGIKRIESRNLSDGSLYAQATDSDGVWPSGANTVNPRGGDGTPIVLNENDATLPVELSSFTANINSQGGITVMWATQSETGVNGYYINRATVNNLSEALRISSLIPASNTSQQQVYVYNDNELYEPGTYYYWLEIQDIDGVVSYYGSRSVTFGGNGNNGTPEIPLVTGIRSIYPNPFNPSATIMYELDQPANVNIEIYNNRGQIVRSFNLGQQEKNRYKLLWDGTDNSGSACGTGIYFVKMQAGKETFVKKAALVK